MTVPPPIPGPQTPGEGLPEVVPGLSPLSLPGETGARAPLPGMPAVRRPTSEPLIGLLGDVVRTGRWEAGRQTVAYEVMGNVKLDLREVLTPGETLEVTAYVLLGDVRVIVPPGTDVQVRGVTLMGDGRTEADLSTQGAPPTGARVIVTVYSLMGNVRVRTMEVGVAKPPRGWRWARPKP